jgi:hypothetical protein
VNLRGQLKQKKAAFTLTEVSNKLIAKKELDTIADHFVTGVVGDPIADKVIAEYVQNRAWGAAALKIFVKRVYYLGMLEGTRRTALDPRLVIYARKKDRNKVKNAFVKNIPRDGS